MVPRNSGHVKRYDPLPLVHPGGYQPHQKGQGRFPGQALLAMLQGSTAGGYNPADSWRAMQKAESARSEFRQRRPRTLLDMLGS